MNRRTDAWQNGCFKKFFQKLFFKSSLLLNSLCGIQVRPPTSSDDICLLFCLFHVLWSCSSPCLVGGWYRPSWRLYAASLSSPHSPPCSPARRCSSSRTPRTVRRLPQSKISKSLQFSCCILINPVVGRHELGTSWPIFGRKTKSKSERTRTAGFFVNYPTLQIWWKFTGKMGEPFSWDEYKTFFSKIQNDWICGAFSSKQRYNNLPMRQRS